MTFLPTSCVLQMGRFHIRKGNAIATSRVKWQLSHICLWSLCVFQSLRNPTSTDKDLRNPTRRSLIETATQLDAWHQDVASCKEDPTLAEESPLMEIWGRVTSHCAWAYLPVPYTYSLTHKTHSCRNVKLILSASPPAEWFMTVNTAKHSRGLQVH